eukprot:m.163442 g.163442  ORF g.163442 m.163442 type:complete len:86 (-) comp17690_c0_seq8:1146-1403(-)
MTGIHKSVATRTTKFLVMVHCPTAYCTLPFSSHTTLHRSTVACLGAGCLGGTLCAWATIIITDLLASGRSVVLLLLLLLGDFGLA